MNLFLFLDDWMIDATRDIIRRWQQAGPADAPIFLDANDYNCVLFDRYIGKYRCWYARFCTGKIPDNKTEKWLDAPFLKGFFYAESEDGFYWRPCLHGGPNDPRFPEMKHSILMPPRPGQYPHKIQSFQSVFIDEREPDETKRYKGASSDGFIFTSPDGIKWAPQRQMQWIRPLDSDTYINMLFNPVTGRYQFFCRPRCLDRRIAIVESEDLKEFSPRRVVLQPDMADPPLHQFYGLVPFWYEDLFIGLLWDHFIPNQEPIQEGNLNGQIKMCGIVDTSLVYSYDGLYWLRGPRTPLLPKAEMPDFGWAGHYVTSLVLGPDNIIRIYSRASRLEHGEFKQQLEFFAKGEGDGAMCVYTMRKDGFAFLEPVGGWGWVRTRGLIPKDGNLTINFMAPLGQVLVQVCDRAGNPYPGFSFDDCTPLTGDNLSAKPRWKEKKLEELVGKWVRLEFKMYQARLYAYRWNCQLHYALDPQERI